MDIKIGDKVKVVDEGKGYTTYQRWANKHSLKNYQYLDDEKLDYFPEGYFKVLVIDYHEISFSTMLAGIEDKDGKHYIIDVEGLEVVGSSLPEPKETEDHTGMIQNPLTKEWSWF